MEKEYLKKLSIIVPVYNVEQYLERCVNSLLEQDLPHTDYEIILINDGSTDNSYQVAQKLAQAHSNIILLSQENRGLSAARNVGLDRARGEYIMFVDSDDFIAVNILGRLISITEQNSLDLCFYRTIFDHGDDSLRIGDKQKFDDYALYSGEQLILQGMSVSSVWQSIYSAEFLRGTDIRFYEGIVHEDVEFCYRLYPFARRVMFTDIEVYHYCVYSQSITRTNDAVKIRKIIESNLHVSHSILKCSESNRYSKDICELYKRIGWSIAVSELIKLVSSQQLDRHTKIECLKTAKNLGVYPVRGKTKSWKTTFLGKIANIELFLRLFFLW